LEQLELDLFPVNYMMQIGDRYGRWTVVGETHRICGKKKGKPRNRRHLVLRCNCGNSEDTVILQKMLLRRPKETGCLKCSGERKKKSEHHMREAERGRIRREKERKAKEERAKERAKERELRALEKELNLQEELRLAGLEELDELTYRKRCHCGSFFSIKKDGLISIRHSQYLVCNRCDRLDKELNSHHSHIKRISEDENYRLRRTSLIEVPPCNRIWLEDKWEFYYYVIDVLGDKPSDEHYIVMIDKDLGYVEGNLRWITKSEHNREMNGATGLEGSSTHYSWRSIKRLGCVESWHTSFRRFLEDVGVKGEEEFYFRPNKNEPFGPDNFEWRYIEGGRGKDNKDYSSWYRRKYLRPWYMCEEWNNDYLQFLSDMGPKPQGAYLCRYDESQPASPTNAYWGRRNGQSIT